MMTGNESAEVKALSICSDNVREKITFGLRKYVHKEERPEREWYAEAKLQAEQETRYFEERDDGQIDERNLDWSLGLAE